MPPGACDEGDAAGPEGPVHHGRAPDHVVAHQLGVEVVGEQGRVEEPLGREVHVVLVDGPGEQGDHHRTEEHVGPLAVAPRHAVTDLGAGRLVEPAGAVEIRDLHGQVGQASHGHRILLAAPRPRDSNDPHRWAGRPSRRVGGTGRRDPGRPGCFARCPVPTVLSPLRSAPATGPPEELGHAGADAVAGP